MKHFFLRKLLLTSSCLAALSIAGLPVKAQTFFNIPDNEISSNIDIFLTSGIDTSATITNADGSFNQTVNITSGNMEIVNISESYRLTQADVISQNGFMIESDDPIIAYLMDNDTPVQSNDITKLFPLENLGTSYRIMAGTSGFTENGSQLSFTATEDNTTVTVTPSANLTTGQLAGDSFDVTLNANESIMYYAQDPASPEAPEDLTGTTLTSNNPIAVFAGHLCANVPENVLACDHIIEQMPTTENFGNEFIIVPTQPDSPGNVIKILADEDNTTVTLNENGTPRSFNLDAGEFITLDEANGENKFVSELSVITSNNPILVGQFMVGVNQTTNFLEGDPSFSLVPDTDEWFDSYIFNVPTSYQKNFFNIAITQNGLNSLSIDGPSGAITIKQILFSSIPETNLLGGLIELPDDGTYQANANDSFMLLGHGFDENQASYFGVGGSIVPNTNPPEPTDTPEPGSLLGLGLMTGLGWLLKKKSNH